MHYKSLVAIEIPEITEDHAKNNEIEKCLKELNESYKLEPNNILLELQIEKLAGLTTEFARTIDNKVVEIMMPYYEGTEDPEYLEFDDLTDELKDAYFNGRPDCIRLPNGSIVESTSYPFWEEFVILEGKVFQKNSGPLHHMKRTKKAKKMTVLPTYPCTKLFKSLEDYAEYRGIPFDEQKERYGFWYNHNAMWDWYSIGGRWPNMFLVKDTCMEVSVGERSWCNSGREYKAPEGYIWVCAARKKDIDWQKMREWDTLKRENDYLKLQRMFSDKKLEDGFRGCIDEKGILYHNERIYCKDESFGDFINRQGIPAEWKYPIYIHDIVDADNWWSRDDVCAGDKENSWHTHIDEYLDSLCDDTVLVGVDYHI